ncbi:phage portal protein [Gemmata sp. G18]|uniref:Phage portal protein n=1 Tax=Gemmata palustris TaxID=2822762 RepID=A0ABS5BMG1_9BACT|nr:phage portal protein [Gemmata palustris]MBP3954914.1 phage portal protein [Gemmata palustris]
MLKQFRNTLAKWLWWKTVERPPGSSWEEPNQYGVTCPDTARTLSPVYAALDLYKRSMSTLPLVTYRRSEKGRERARNHPAYPVLHDRINAGMSPITFFEILIDAYFLYGEFFGLVQTRNSGELLAIYPIPNDTVLKVTRDENWRKVYEIRMADGTKEFADGEIVHIIKDTEDGLRGRSIIDFAASNLSLHRQVQQSANAFYKHATKPSVYVKGEWGTAEARAEFERKFNEKYAGVGNSGKAPFVSLNTDIVAFPNTTAEESRVIEMLSSSVADCSRWFGVSPLLLSDLTRGTYSNLAADNEAFYQRSLRPLLVKVESELRSKLFPSEPDVYCEFLASAILRGSPDQQQAIFNGYVQSGVMLISEVREQLDLPFVEGTDVPLRPVNQAVVTGAADAMPLEQTPPGGIQP